MIDLHTHSTASDGTLSPEGLVDLAAEKGLSAIALTDHDTVAGIAAARARGAERGLEVIPGVELAAEWEGAGQMHLLGYFIDDQHPYLLERLRWLREHRLERARKIVTRLKKLGAPISWERVVQIAGGAALGRPHLAAALVEAGHVGSVLEAFNRYLKDGAPAFLEKVQFKYREALRLIRLAGGVAVLAHPATLKLPPEGLEACVQRLVRKGLQGIEAYWSKHDKKEASFYADVGRRYGLVLTAGSDFHGSNKPGIELGQYPMDGWGGDGAGALLQALRLRKPAAPA
jgi:predicted metal-dependent phosphoesterase TrpH